MHDNTIVQGVSTVFPKDGDVHSVVRHGVALLMLIAMLFAASTAQAAPDTSASQQLIVGFTDDTSRSAENSLVRGTDARIGERLPGGMAVVEIAPGVDPDAVIDRLEASDAVRWASPNHTVQAMATPTDPMIVDGTFWDLLRIHAPQAWQSGDGSGAVVAVLDSGVSSSNPDLAGQLWTNPGEIPGNGIDDDGNGYIDDVHGYDWLGNDPVPEDKGGHGTHVAGTIAAASGNGFGGAGVAPGARIMPLRFLDANGSGQIDDAIRAIDYAIANGADVINASWGGHDYSPPLRDAFARAAAAGITVVAAAGNVGLSNDRYPLYPASFDLPNVISVAASDRNDRLAGYSNFGRSVTIAAPGHQVVSTKGNGTAAMSGTSMAAPQVAGVAALLRGANPQLSPQGVIGAIKLGVRRVSGLAKKTATGGVVDAAGAMSVRNEIIPTSGKPLAGPAPARFHLRKPGRKVRVRGRSGVVRFSWSKAHSRSTVRYRVVIGGKVRARVKGTSAKLRIRVGKWKWSVVAVDTAGKTRRATRTRSSVGQLKVMRVKTKKKRR